MLVTRKMTLTSVLSQAEDSPRLAIEVFTDAGGHRWGGPGVGNYIPQRASERPLVVAFALPQDFLYGVISKSASRENLSYLAAWCLDPLRFLGREVIFYADNEAAVLALREGQAKDRLAKMIIRASRVVGAGLGCRLSTRKSSQSRQ